MNGRYFAGNQLEVEYYDGVSNFRVPSPEAKRKARDAQWAKWLEDESTDDEDKFHQD